MHIQGAKPPNIPSRASALDLENSSAGGQDRANVILLVEPEIVMLEDQRFDDTARDLNEEAR